MGHQINEFKDIEGYFFFKTSFLIYKKPFLKYFEFLLTKAAKIFSFFNCQNIFTNKD